MFDSDKELAQAREVVALADQVYKKNIVLTTDHPLYARVVDVLFDDLHDRVVGDMKRLCGISDGGEIPQITEADYERAFCGVGGAGCADVVAGAAAADLTLQSMSAVAAGGNHVKRELSGYPAYDPTVELVKLAVNKGFLTAKARYDDTVGGTTMAYDLQGLFGSLHLRLPDLRVMHRVMASVPVRGKECYHVDYAKKEVRVWHVAGLQSEVFPMVELQEQLHRQVLNPGVRQSYQDVMTCMYAAVYRDFFRRLGVMLSDGPALTMSSTEVELDSPLFDLTVKRVGVDKVFYGADDVVLVPDDVGCLPVRDVMPKVCLVDGYFPRGDNVYVIAPGVYGQGNVDFASVVALGVALRRVRTLIVVTPGDADLEVVHEEFVVQSLQSVQQQLFGGSRIVEVLSAWLTPRFSSFTVKVMGTESADYDMLQRVEVAVLHDAEVIAARDKMMGASMVSLEIMRLGLRWECKPGARMLLDLRRVAHAVVFDDSALLANLDEFVRVGSVTLLVSGTVGDHVVDSRRMPEGGMSQLDRDESATWLAGVVEEVAIREACGDFV